MSESEKVLPNAHLEARSPTVDIDEKSRMFEKNHMITPSAIAHTRVTSVPPRIV